MTETPRLINYPSHTHPLELTDGMAIYPQHNGAWQCDNCQLDQQNSSRPYHCQICEFDVCINCALPKSHPRHPGKPLYRVSTEKIYPQYNGQWLCDGCEITKPAGFANHCYLDQFDICDKCFGGHNLPIHRHPLKPVNAAVKYNNATGWWACNCCKRHGTDIGT